eukprot:Gb_24155 [translate_table: standard]
MSMMKSSSLLLFMTVLLMTWAFTSSRSISVEAQNISGRSDWPKVTALIVFGDSTADPGNNDRLSSTFKSNFLPYGRDFIDHKPTGRFCNGKLTTDFIAAGLGLKETLPAFLDPQLKPADLLTGVSFASAATGYDNLTAKISSVIPLWKQVQYFKHYRVQLANAFEEGSSPFHSIKIFFSKSVPVSLRFYLSIYLSIYIYILKILAELYKLGARRFAVLGLPPLGCLPIERTLQQPTRSICVGTLNQVATSFNTKLEAMLYALNKDLPRLKLVYVDIYNVLFDAVHNPGKYGFEISMRGCCGTGLIEYGLMCKSSSTCSDGSKYVFWDAIHPTEKMYSIIAKLRSGPREGGEGAQARKGGAGDSEGGRGCRRWGTGTPDGEEVGARGRGKGVSGTREVGAGRIGGHVRWGCLARVN